MRGPADSVRGVSSGKHVQGCDSYSARPHTRLSPRSPRFPARSSRGHRGDVSSNAVRRCGTIPEHLKLQGLLMMRISAMISLLTISASGAAFSRLVHRRENLVAAKPIFFIFLSPSNSRKTEARCPRQSWDNRLGAFPIFDELEYPRDPTAVPRERLAFRPDQQRRRSFAGPAHRPTRKSASSRRYRTLAKSPR